MNIGLTYDLREAYLALGYSEDETAEFDRGDTIDSIEAALVALGHVVDRIGNVMELAARLVAGGRWDLVFNISEGMYGMGREAQVPALLDAYQIPYTFSDPMVASLTLHKGMTKHVLRDAGIATTDFVVVEDVSDIERVRFEYPVFAKPVGEGTAKGIDATSRIDNEVQLRARCRKLLDRYDQPVLVEPYLSGREFTTSIVGTGSDARVLGTLEIGYRKGVQTQDYTYQNKEHCEELIDYSLTDENSARDCAALALKTWRSLGCRDAGRVDLRADELGKLFVLEVNPLPGMHPSHSDLPMTCTAIGMSYRELIWEIVESASTHVTRRTRLKGVSGAR